MSVSKYMYDPEKCEGDYCIGDCDLCSKAYDGLMERVSDTTASKTLRCLYPDCDKCAKYIGFCLVPLVITKQMWLDLMGRLDNLSALAEDINEILGLQHSESDR